MPKFKVHPLFIALAAVMIAIGKGYAFLSSIAAVVLHELAHAVAAKNQGYVSGSITLLPYGAVLSTSEDLDRNSEVIIAAAGPICNFILAIITVALWWLIPACLPYTDDFYTANLTIGFFNLLPAYPLDGSRILLGLIKNAVPQSAL